MMNHNLVAMSNCQTTFCVGNLVLGQVGDVLGSLLNGFVRLHDRGLVLLHLM